MSGPVQRMMFLKNIDHLTSGDPFVELALSHVPFRVKMMPINPLTTRVGRLRNRHQLHSEKYL